MPSGYKTFILRNMSKSSIGTCIDLLLLPIKSRSFVYLLLLNGVSNMAYMIYARNGFAIFSMVMLAALLAYLEMTIYQLLHWKWLRSVWLILVIVFHNILIFTDYFLLCQFKTVIGQDVVDILSETNPVEAQNFFDTYFLWPSIIVWIVLLSALNVLIIWLSQMVIKHTPYVWPCACCILAGIGIMVFCVYNFALYRNGMAIPQYQTPMRLGYSLYILNQRAKRIEILKEICKGVKATTILDKQPTIVVIIGESFSVYHSSLMGYEKETNPLLQRRAANGSLFTFDNAVSVSCLTHSAMESVFFLDSLGYGKGCYPFPACFKAVGYKTALYDNQYFVGNGVTFLSNTKLSELLFDRRNTRRYQYDMDMVKAIEPFRSPSLIIIHLWGQHYQYNQRYPDSFCHFTTSDYDSNKWTEKQREIIAHYDNATRYNDYVVDRIIQLFQNENCCIVYFSDHGEEIFENGDYMGHGNAEHSKDLSYQIRVPLMVWVSSTFSRPELKEKLLAAQHIPIMTDDISHFLLDIAGIRTPEFAPTRSFINDQYNTKKPRIVLHSIDYDYR